MWGKNKNKNFKKLKKKLRQKIRRKFCEIKEKDETKKLKNGGKFSKFDTENSKCQQNLKIKI